MTVQSLTKILKVLNVTTRPIWIENWICEVLISSKLWTTYNFHDGFKYAPLSDSFKPSQRRVLNSISK